MAQGQTRKASPLGLMPYDIWHEKVVLNRMHEIMAAMQRYTEAKLPVPVEWVKELREHILLIR